MKTFYGTTVIQARSMTYGTFLAATSVPNDGIHSVLERGYFIEPKGWLPKDQFEAQYQRVDNLDFSHALTAMKQGHRVTRKAWMDRLKMEIDFESEKFLYTRLDPQQEPEVMMHVDMMANDWRIVE